MFEITTRPPNSYIFQQQFQPHSQQHPHLQHRRNHIQFRSPRSSSLSTPITNLTSSYDKQFFLHNDINNLTHVNRNSNVNNDLFYTSSFPVTSPVSNSSTANIDKYVTRILTNNNNFSDKKRLTSSSASYFHPNDHLFNADKKNLAVNGTVLPVFYQNESTGQTTPLPTINKITVNGSKPPLNKAYHSSSNILPNLLGNNVGSATSIVTVTNNMNTNGVKTYQQIKPQISSIHGSYSNIADSETTNSRLSKANIPLMVNKNTDSDYPLKLTTKQYSVIKGIKARQEMLSSSSIAPSYFKTNSYEEREKEKVSSTLNPTATISSKPKSIYNYPITSNDSTPKSANLNRTTETLLIRDRKSVV